MRLKDVDAVQIGVYYDALSGFTLERVRDAATRWMQTGKFFPTTGEWASACRDLIDALPRAAWEPHVYLNCPECSDTGWVFKDCVTGSRCGALRCIEKGADWKHVYVVRCACFSSEPVA